MVAMTRAHIADPHIVRKIEAGQEDRIRPCVGATHCQSQYRPHCLHNPSTGTRNHAAARDRTRRCGRAARSSWWAAVRPAWRRRGCARERGHEVVLFEAADRLGGQVLLGARASWRKDLLGIVDWRQAELERLGVEVRLNAYAEAADVQAEAPDVVIVATGGVPDIDWIEGAEHCTSVWDAIGGAVALGAEIIVYDGTGRHPAPQVAELAAREGRQVSFVSIDAQLAQELTYAERVIWKKRMYELAVPMTFDHEIAKVERKGNRIVATFRNLITQALVERAADQIIVEHGTLPADELYRALRGAAANDGVTDLPALLAREAAAPKHPAGGALRAAPGRRCGGEPQRPRRHARLLAALRGVVDDSGMQTMHKQLSEPVDVAIVGAGIMGCATAWHLATRGIKVARVRALRDRFRAIQPRLGFHPPAGAPRSRSAACHRSEPALGRDHGALRRGQHRLHAGGILVPAETADDEGRIADGLRSRPPPGTGYAPAE